MSSITTRRAIVNVIEKVGGGNPPPPLFPPSEEDEDSYLPDIYEKTDFYIVFEFLIEQTTESLNEDGNTEVEIYPATTVITNFDFDYYGLTYTQINSNTIRLEGAAENVFPDEYYKFVLPDEENDEGIRPLKTEILPFDTSVPYYSLIEYKEPNNKLVRLEYQFIVDGLSTVVYHWIHWSFDTAKESIEYTISQGLA